MKTRKVRDILLILCFALGILSLPSGYPFAFSDLNHEPINRAAGDSSQIYTRLKQCLGFPLDSANRNTQLFPSPLDGSPKTIRELLAEGGEQEDVPVFRTVNHFHDPLLDWDQAEITGDGLVDLQASLSRLRVPFLGEPHSALLWATDPYGGLGDLGANINQWSWFGALREYKLALTAPTATERNAAFGRVFRSLGQVSHLIADMSVPEHVRNDGHAAGSTGIYGNFEFYCSKYYDRLAYAANETIDDTIFNLGGRAGVPAVSNLWDARADAGYGNLSLHPRHLMGLAEFTNYNFLSYDTVFKTYDHPSRAEISGFYTDTLIVGSTPYKVAYYSRQNSDGTTLKHLAAVALHYRDWLIVPDDIKKSWPPARLDDNCFKEYAQKLIPMASSFGSKMLDYFFRARFEVTARGNNITVKNLSPGRVEGLFSVYPNYDLDFRNKVPELADRLIALDADDTVTFTLTNPPIPDEHFLFVYDGNLANPNANGALPQERVVAGQVFAWENEVVLPTAPRSHSSSWTMKPYMVGHTNPAAIYVPPTNGSIGCTCHFDNDGWGQYPGLLGDDMSQLQLCRDCHGSDTVVDDVPNYWEYGTPPRIMVSPGAANTDWMVDYIPVTFNPKWGDTVSGTVQFLPAFWDWVHYGPSPLEYRLEVRDLSGSVVYSYPSSGWKKGTSLFFLRYWSSPPPDSWGYAEQMLWESTQVPNGAYDFRFYFRNGDGRIGNTTIRLNVSN
jgi:hypothetical protein